MGLASGDAVTAVDAAERESTALGPDRTGPTPEVSATPPGTVPVVAFGEVDTRQLLKPRVTEQVPARKACASFVAFLEVQERTKVSVPPRMKRALCRAFEDADKDADGFLSAAEVEEALEERLSWRDRSYAGKVLQEAMVRIDLDKDKVLDWRDFMEKSVKFDPHLATHLTFLVQGLLVSSFFFVAPLVYCIFNVDEGDWSIWDALYFAAVTVTTIGYGDLVPVNDGMKVFTIVYILYGIAIVAKIIDDIVFWLIQYYEDKLRLLDQKLTKMATQESIRMRKSAIGRCVTWAGASLRHLCPGVCGCGRNEKRSKIILSVSLFVLPLLSGTLVMGLNEDWPWLHALYWSVVTCTTVGYGDLKPEKESSRIFAIVFVLAGFAAVGTALANIGELRIQMAMERREKELLDRSLSLDMIADMDKDGNGVDRCEFVCAMLVQLGKVNQEDVLPLLAKFEELDLDGSGKLTSKDLEILWTQRRRQLRRRRAEAVRLPEPPGLPAQLAVPEPCDSSSPPLHKQALQSRTASPPGGSRCGPDQATAPDCSPPQHDIARE